MIWSYFVRGRFSCSNESNAPWVGFADWVSSCRTVGWDHTHPLAVDGHLGVRVDTQVRDLGDIPHALHVRRIASCAENTRDACSGIHVVRRDQRSRRIARERDNIRRHRLRREAQREPSGKTSMCAEINR